MRKCPGCSREYDDTSEVCDCGQALAASNHMADDDSGRAAGWRRRYGACDWACFVGAAGAFVGGAIGLGLGWRWVAHLGEASEGWFGVLMLCGLLAALVGAVVGAAIGAIICWYIAWALAWREAPSTDRGA